MFIGGFAHPPNEEGIIWFIEFILPLIRRKIPDIHLTIVGSDPTERVKAMAVQLHYRDRVRGGCIRLFQ